MPKIDKSNAAEIGAIGGRKSAEARAARRKLRGDQRARKKFEDVAADMADILIQAARGQEEFSALTAKDKATFAQKVLEYGMGRARPMADEAPVDDGPKGGLTFGVRDDNGG